MASAELPSDQSDDFEIISPSLDPNLSVPPSLDLASPHFESAPNCPAFEPETAFVLLVQNTQQLKQELLKQQSDLAHGLERAKKDREEQDKHLADITSQLTDLEAENMCVKAENLSLRAQLQPFDEAREKVDELTAQLCQSQDVIKNQEQIIRQFQWEDRYKAFNDRCVMMGLLADYKMMLAGGFVSLSLYEYLRQTIDVMLDGPSMTVGRVSASSAMIGGDMYVCGGCDHRFSRLSSCEVYRDGQWVEVASMIEPRAGHATVALDGLLYAIGGYNNRKAECYSPDKDSWGPVASLKQERDCCSAAALNGCIYVAGGDSTSGLLKSCERYDPKEDKWEPVADMNKERSRFSLVSMGGKLYALGGDKKHESWWWWWSKVSEGLSVESYDPATNTWKIEFNGKSPSEVRCALAVGSDLCKIITRSFLMNVYNEP